MAGRKYSNQTLKRKIFGGRGPRIIAGRKYPGHSGLWGMGSSDKSMAKAKAADKEAADQAEFNRRRKAPGNEDMPISDMMKGLFESD